MLIEQPDQVIADGHVNQLESAMHRAAASHGRVRCRNEIKVVKPVVDELSSTKRHDQLLIRFVKAEPAEMQIWFWIGRQRSDGSIRGRVLVLVGLLQHALQHLHAQVLLLLPRRRCAWTACTAG